MSSSKSCLVLCVVLSMLLSVAHLQDVDESEVDENEDDSAEVDVKPKYLTKDEFNMLVESGDRFVVNFVSPGCIKCNEFAPEYEEVALHFATERADMNIKVFIEGDLQTIRKQGLRRLPSLYYVRDKTPLLYTGEMDAQSIIHFVEVTGRRIHIPLSDDDFERRTQVSTGATTGDWFVLFCDVEHVDCSVLLPMWENIAYRLHSLINVAVVDIPKNPKTAKRFQLSGSPAMHLFRKGKQYVYTLQMRDDSTVVQFAQNGYKRFPGVDVLPEQSPFDTLTENIADQLKEVLPESHSSKLIVIGLPVVVVLLIIVFISRRRASDILPGRTKKGV
ncbi:protein disulfide-isomerase A4 [Strongylocentrotus purpuratus]|uniref:Thioredoxin domain-containing protein n=1 Tax=Strongylocentrotus purpuratus TaxID=7668 RepID=A0A7M7RBI2_STRPU|nr:protein disulfide-isomerase A4 [Strongylocentrotus purpuratus]